MDEKLYLAFLKAESELVENGYAAPEMPDWSRCNWTEAMDDEMNELIGFILYEEKTDECDIKLGWVDPAHRGKGIYSRMWETLMWLMQSKGVSRITSRVHVDNEKMLRLADKQGRKPLYTVFDYDLTGE